MEDYTERYIAELDDITEKIGKRCKDPRQMAIAYMEYIRLACMYENLDINNEIQNYAWENLFSGLSCSPLNVAILGKGVCASQACFLSDLLISSGIDAKHLQVHLDDNSFHEVVEFELDGEKKFLDPTFYNGTIESFNGSYSKINGEMRSKTMDNITQEEINEGSKIVKDYLIERYGIREISEQLKINDSTSDIEKHLKILAFCNTHLAPVPKNAHIKFRSVMLGDKEIERGKLMELFYTANDIPYKVITMEKDNGDHIISYPEKQDAGLMINIDKEEQVIIPNHKNFQGKVKKEDGEDYCYDMVMIQARKHGDTKTGECLIYEPKGLTINETVLGSGEEKVGFCNRFANILEIREQAKKIKLERGKVELGYTPQEVQKKGTFDKEPKKIERNDESMGQKETKDDFSWEEWDEEMKVENANEPEESDKKTQKVEEPRKEQPRETKKYEERPREQILNEDERWDFSGLEEEFLKYVDDILEHYEDTPTPSEPGKQNDFFSEGNGKMYFGEEYERLTGMADLSEDELSKLSIEELDDIRGAMKQKKDYTKSALEKVLKEKIIAEIESDKTACKEYEAMIEKEKNEDGRDI